VTRLLLLTTPELHGPDVVSVQQLLIHHGDDPGAVDGIYGPTTAAAVRRFQKHAGLRVDGVVGAHTLEALTSTTPAPLAPQHPGRPAPGELALAWMLERVGMTADPAPHHCPITEEFRLGDVAWCMETVSLAFKHGANYILGDSLPHPWGYWDGRGFAYVPAFESWAKTRGFWIGRVQVPKPGDVACYSWNGGSTPEHVGIVKEATAVSVFDAVEGNTGSDRGYDGGQLLQQRRELSEVVGFARIRWQQP